MRSSQRVFLLPAMLLALTTGPAIAGPESCLSFENNFAVAACANQFMHGMPTQDVRPGPTASRKAIGPLSGFETFQMYNVPAIQTRAVDPSGGRKALQADVERAELLNRAAVAMSIAAGLGLLVALFRWRVSLVRNCKFCAAKLTPGASVCRKCFRAI
jgi:hypothetical protein